MHTQKHMLAVWIQVIIAFYTMAKQNQHQKQIDELKKQVEDLKNMITGYHDYESTIE